MSTDAESKTRGLLEQCANLRRRLEEEPEEVSSQQLAVGSALGEGVGGDARCAMRDGKEVEAELGIRLPEESRAPAVLEGGFVRFPKAIPVGELKGAELKVLTYLYGLADPAGFCWPSQRAIREATDLSRSGVQKALRGLVEAAWVEVVDRKDPVFGRVANGYQLRPLPAAAKSFETRDVSRPKRRRKTGGEPALFT